MGAGSGGGHSAGKAVRLGPRAIRKLTVAIAKQHGIRPELFRAQIKQESGFHVNARSPAGAIGVAQIIPSTARKWHVNPHNPIAALHAAARNMARYFRTYQAQGHDPRTAEKLALAAYNAGPQRVAQFGGVPPYQETQNYVRTIMREAGR